MTILAIFLRSNTTHFAFLSKPTNPSSYTIKIQPQKLTAASMDTKPSTQTVSINKYPSEQKIQIEDSKSPSFQKIDFKHLEFKVTNQ
jgi:hypothetical protein